MSFDFRLVWRWIDNVTIVIDLVEANTTTEQRSRDGDAEEINTSIVHDIELEFAIAKLLLYIGKAVLIDDAASLGEQEDRLLHRLGANASVQQVHADDQGVND